MCVKFENVMKSTTKKKSKKYFFNKTRLPRCGNLTLAVTSLLCSESNFFAKKRQDILFLALCKRERKKERKKEREREREREAIKGPILILTLKRNSSKYFDVRNGK